MNIKNRCQETHTKFIVKKKAYVNKNKRFHIKAAKNKIK